MEKSPRRFSQEKLLHNTLQLNQTIAQTKRHMVWGFINVALVAALVYNILGTTLDESLKTHVLYNGQLILAVMLAINSCFHLIKYSVKKLNMQPICLSPSQRKLLGIGPTDRYYKSPEAAPKTAAVAGSDPPFTATCPMNLSTSSWLSPTALNESTSPSRVTNVAVSPSSPWAQSGVPSPPWANQSGGPSPAWANQAVAYPLWTSQSGSPRSPGEDPITDEASLTRFLDAVEEQERRAAVGVSAQCSTTFLGSFWNNPSPRAAAAVEVSPLLRRCAYQMAPVSPVTPSTSPGVLPEDGNSPVAVSNTEFWRRVKVDPGRLTQWNANLRMWVSLTILQRVVSELDHIDAAFVRCGLSDLHLGSVGLDRLKRTASIPQVVASIPSLPRLVPFLELSQHQEYLVTRIRELAKGGSMSEFRWNSGGSLNGKAWEEHLPTDAALVMHLIATYLDLQLVPTPQRPDATPSRPFSAQHLVRSPERPPVHPHIPVIHQAQLNPPHFQLLDKDQVYDVPKGRNNVFHTFLLFLHLLKTREHGMLGPVNLGRSGVNVLWVVDS